MSSEQLTVNRYSNPLSILPQPFTFHASLFTAKKKTVPRFFAIPADNVREMFMNQCFLMLLLFLTFLILDPGQVGHKNTPASHNVGPDPFFHKVLITIFETLYDFGML